MSGSGAATVVLDVVDFSRNEICDRGLSILVDLLLEQPPRVLRLFRDQISDATPIEKLLAKGSLHELHLSNNQISAASALRIAVSAATAVDKYGTHIYPIGDVTLLWLRFENNFGSSNGFARELCQEMCKAKRPEAICFVDGKTSCNPKRCDCPGGPRAVHVLHVGSSIFNKRVHPASGEDQSRGSCTRHYTEWRTAAPKREKLPPSIAPWRRAAGPPLRHMRRTICWTSRPCLGKLSKFLLWATTVATCARRMAMGCRRGHPATSCCAARVMASCRA